MDFAAFGRNSGPTGPPAQAPKFGDLPEPRPPPPLSRYPRDLGAFETMHAPPSAFEVNPYVFRPSQPSVGMPRTINQSPPLWDTGQNYYYKSYSSQSHQRPPNVVINTSISPAGIPAKASQTQDFQRTRSPPSPFSDEEHLRHSRSVRVSRAGLPSKSASDVVPRQQQSSPLDLQRKSLGRGTRPPFNEAELPASSFPIWGNQSKSLTSESFINPLTRPVMPSVFTSVDTHNSGRKAPVSYADIQIPKRSRSPTFHSSNDNPAEDATFASYNSQRPSASPPKMRSNSHSPENSQLSPTLECYNKEVSKKSMSFPAAKKTKLPSLSSSDQVFQEGTITREDETDRELEAKAKRLARFKDELNQPMQNDGNAKDQRVPTKRQLPVMVERRKVNGDPAMATTGNSSNSNVPSDYESMDSSTIIIGSCLDMCPESERAERERKGDLDQYERLDGDRNQTNESLAVKKYNRTAEREAELIRPMPILQKTMDYLLNLLNRPYGDNFLGLYNFLWDRMRAIRMDLRMQHIFSLGAIKMLEQMIRLHIIAMHELCEYTKGEGFSEGFDAHLNIEQMNKTSVELFQLYDDHRKNGENVVTEKEFRGYYALLKLDKHPGYKVEPAELSLDLAKMTSELRQTPEVVFARDVARACRTGNFIAFFRLARKASYLQACLMHAHFAKLRTQALASLHGGLQNNQGIPVAHVASWLGMEEENIEELLEYHGFSIKDFEVPFMVKEGPFLNVDSDYPVKCSILVEQKKSKTIVEDMKHPRLAKSSSPEKAIGLLFNEGAEQNPAPVKIVENDSFQAVDEEMPDYTSSLKDDMEVMPRNVTVVNQTNVFEETMFPATPSIWRSSSFHDSPKSMLTRIGSFPKSQLTRIGSGGKSKYDARFRNSLDRDVQVDVKGTPSHIVSRQVDKDSFLVPLPPVDQDQHAGPEHFSSEEMEEQLVANREAEADEMDTTSFDQEVAEAKIRLIFRIWKRHSLKKRELREQKRLVANAALTSLSLGLPIRQPEIQSGTFGDFNLDWFMSKRYAVQEKTWSKLNVSDVVAATLAAKNPDAKCLCWKILLFTEEDCSYGGNLGKKKEVTRLAASSWLRSKLVPTSAEDDHADDLAFSSPGLSIWKKWYPSQSSDGWTCYLTVVREAKLENLNEVVAGSSAILFPIAECIPWQFQRNRLQNVLTALSFDSRLPLLILSDSCKDNLDPSTIINELGLLDIDRSRLSTFFVAFLKNQQMENRNVFFSDEQLKEGLQWLANELPSQPDLSWMKTRELVLFHLNPSLEVLSCKDVHKVGPNDCISTFNKALDQSLEKVTAAVHANPISWPCPEIALLPDYSNEYRAVSQYLPSLGWSSATRIEPLICALTNSRLPPFEDISWLHNGADGGNGIETQRLKLENCLIKYFTESSQMMALPLSTEEASLMLRKFARLELHNSTYYIVPHWVLIFQRVFHWRLTDLSNGASSSAYILSHDYASIMASGVLDKTDVSMPLSSLVYPSFDEMVEIGCTSPIQRVQQLDFEASLPYSKSSEISKTISEVNTGEDGGNVEQGSKLVRKDECIAIEAKNGSESASATKATKEADKLSQLLAKCNILQNMIEEKLSVYF